MTATSERLSPFAIQQEFLQVSSELNSSQRSVNDIVTQRLNTGDYLLKVGGIHGRDFPVYSGKLGRSGLIVGMDNDQYDTSTLLRAQQVAGDSGLQTPVRLIAGDISSIPCPADTFNTIYLERTLQHAPDPVLATQEAHRVLRKGGHLVIAETDWGIMNIKHPNTADSDKIMEYEAAKRTKNSIRTIELKNILKDIGFQFDWEFSAVDKITNPEIFRRVFSAEGLDSLLVDMAAKGELSNDAVIQWVKDMYQAAAHNQFYLNYITTIIPAVKN